MLCPKCKKSDLIVDLESGGGCKCGPNPDGYCYCDSPYTRLALCCSNNKRVHPQGHWEKRKWVLDVPGEDKCDFTHIPREFADTNSIERLLAKLIEMQPTLLQEMLEMKSQDTRW